jgi:hypothetical protein
MQLSIKKALKALLIRNRQIAVELTRFWASRAWFSSEDTAKDIQINAARQTECC